MCNFLTSSENLVLEQALLLLEKIMEQHPSYGDTPQFSNPEIVRDYLRMKIATDDRENFVVLFLDNQHKLISSEVLFQGTFNTSAVYPREIIKRALELNAGALILAHNHPSGKSTPSEADKNITFKIKQAAELFDIRVLDHFVVTLKDTFSFVENFIL
ncbi:DNA repair protein RadC [Ursidibacter maritimus]|uniref:DNA repair protein RadC n=1 Tax=Ursidibacter maritimus TaxID=1331689 RepID=A0A949SY25_9PAST|nr:DNA repair protein RadC [Ursidibacter maritimus]KAE9541347.1 hypothetical protein A1D26_00065 [Ursidibacter maritimus]MBV6524456.1 DNA repair protein RadC [Ursidibacter maritimus]MBV6526510.1 DNA repair protein RadC [Ursidibacter maritimus]MBV6527086.1 DNA repair protein RadC [Ursidibacter maritimus]MBV6530397.1 DNA repair protein RadC [Ursidibacter maritimus]